MRIVNESASRIQKRHGTAGRRRRLTYAVEALEERSLMSGAGFTVSVHDPGNLLAAYPMAVPTVEAAGQILNGLIAIQKPISIAVVPEASYSGGYDGASATGSSDLLDSKTQDGAYEVVKPESFFDAVGQVPPNGPTEPPDITITLNTSLMGSDWFDPTGAARSDPVPASKVDFLSTALHELLHSLGLSYIREQPTSVLPPGGTTPIAVPGQINPYTEDTAFGTGADGQVLYFTGPTAKAEYGGPVPLYSVPTSDPMSISNYSHVGGSSGYPGADLIDLMNATGAAGTRYNVSNLDLAILADIGYTVLDYPGLQPAVSYGSSLGGFTVSTGSSLSKVKPIGTPKGTIGAVLQFSGPLDAEDAVDVSSYSVTLPGKLGPHHIRKPAKTIRISSAIYNPATNQVTLTLARPIARGQAAQLVVHGLLDSAGQPVGGDLTATLRGVVVRNQGGRTGSSHFKMYRQ
jgi:hypothetical protein